MRSFRSRVPDPVGAALKAVRPPRPFNIDTYLDAVARFRGNRLVLHEDDLPSGVCGLWRFDGVVDHIHVPRGSAGAHRWQIIGHEVGHMLMAAPYKQFGHGLSKDMQANLTMLFPDLDPMMLARYRARSQYDDREERHAELYGTLAVAEIYPEEPEAGRIGRIRQALDGMQ